MSRNPATTLENYQDRRLGCWLCVHSRADRRFINCAQLPQSGPVEERFPVIGIKCVEFKRREGM